MCTMERIGEKEFWLILILIMTWSSSCTNDLTWDEENWDRTLILDKEMGIKISWNISHVNETETEIHNFGLWLDMQVFAPTKGYIGLGWSPHGGMKSSDIVLMWVDDKGQGQLRDMHGIGNEKPQLDTEQNYELVQALETADGTTVWFRRPLVTCDYKDMEITNHTMRIIWALGPKDPISTGDDSEISFDYHGTNQRGVKSVYLIDKPIISPFPDDPGQDSRNSSVIFWDLMMSNTLIEAVETTYMCKIVKFPHTQQKHQMIGYRPMITPVNEKLVHHICMYECVVPIEMGSTGDSFEEHLEKNATQCYSPNMPLAWALHCSTFFMCWVVGSEGEMFPDHVGSAIGEEHNGATYFMLEIHYHNPNKLKFEDSSGMRIFLQNEEIRGNDANVMAVGHRVSPIHLIPPLQQNFQSVAICSADCTEATVPSEGIKIVSVLLHAHLAARKIRLRHFRNGIELAKIGEDNFYDFNYQQTRFLKEEVTILPGDQLVTECEYETLDRNSSIIGGLAATKEMCVVFLMYYPKINLAICSSQPEYNSFFNSLGIQKASGKVFTAINYPYHPNEWPEEKQKYDTLDDAGHLLVKDDGTSYRDEYDLMIIEQPESLENVTVGDYLHSVNWRDKQFSKRVENGWINGKHNVYCTGHGRRRNTLNNNEASIPSSQRSDKGKETDNFCDESNSLKFTSASISLQLNTRGVYLITIVVTIIFGI